MERYICIHGHFYQPPRENPWLEVIEQQDEAYPYHDWNEKITAECYATNSASRILDEQGLIERIVNNYARMSFDFGPTLLTWLETKAPQVYTAILEADRRSRETFSGHGSALAQAYNHIILPLANRSDKYTQVLWGIRDFEHRFGRRPEGMWLPETAVDLESLEIMAELGVQFTILAPRQAQKIRDIKDGDWEDVTGEKIDSSMAYLLRLPSGRSISLLFYNGATSRAVAFEEILRNGESFAKKLLEGFSEDRDWPQLVHIVTDGETYGHHHRFGDMALSYALNHIETNNLAHLTNYGEYLERHPPRYEVEIFENSSWSCSHGVERWRGDCGCNLGDRPGWNQTWRIFLREALDWLRDTITPQFEDKAGPLLKDPWLARNDYIEVVLQRSTEVAEQFLARHALSPLTETDRVTVLKLMELQRHSMLMYTSCGWFFDDLAGIETVQIISYAARVLQLAQELFGNNLESSFLEKLKGAQSNRPEVGDGSQIYESSVRGSMFDLARVGAHYAMCSLFQDYPETAKIYCYIVERQDYQSYETGRARLVLGKIKVTSQVTLASGELGFAVIHLGDHNLSGGVREFSDDNSYLTMAREMSAAFGRADFADTIRVLDKNFAASTYTLKSLFPDDQRKILDVILETTLEEADSVYRQLYERHAPLLRFLKDTDSPPPRAFTTAAEFVMNASINRAFENDGLNLDRIEYLMHEAESEGISLDLPTLEYGFRQALERLAAQLAADPSDLSLLKKLEAAASLVGRLPFEVNLWKAQNVCYDILQTTYGEFQARAEQGDESASRWLQHFNGVAASLLVRV